ncbi:MAG: mechanosensitive ion channel [Phycisphaerae bacterium]|nr:mechanosensitive ion channel [Phycisphaerae bacterium]
MRSQLLILLVLVLSLVGLPRAARTQEVTPAEVADQTEEQPTTQPATQAASQPVNHLRSPYSTICYFLATVRDEARGDDRYVEGMKCLDDSAVDAEAWKTQGPEYVRKLNAILERLEKKGLFDPEDKEVFPDEPGGRNDQVQSFGLNPLVLVLERITTLSPGEDASGSPEERKEWKFAASVVADIPKWYEGLDGLLERLDRQTAIPTPLPGEEGLEELKPDSLSSPFHMMRFFLKMAESARTKKGSYFPAARECLDFSEVATETLKTELGLDSYGEAYAELLKRGPEYVRQLRQEKGTTYVEQLEAIVGWLISDGTLDMKRLEAEPTSEIKPTWAIGKKPLLVILVRQGTGQWRFSAQTVRNAPRMTEGLAEEVAEQPTPAPAIVAPDEGVPLARPEVAAPAPPREEPSELFPEDTATPSATLNTFRDAIESNDLKTAVSCLDLSQLSAVEREFAHILAGKLWLVLIRHEELVGKELDNQAAKSTRVTLFGPYDEGRIELQKQQRGERQGEWLFSKRTVRDIDDLYEALENRPVHKDWEDHPGLSILSLPGLYVREYLIRPSLKQDIAGLKGWQWIGIALVLVLGALVRVLSQMLLPWISRRLLRTEGAEVLPRALRRALRPTSNLAMVAVWWVLLQFLDLGATIMSWAWPVLKVVMALVGVYASYRLVDVVASFLAARASRTATRMDDVLVPLVKKTVKVAVVALGFVFILSAFGYEIDKWLAALGVGGLAISFAAKDTIANLFGSVNVVLDRPFQVGDWVKIGDSEGTVESVGLRSSRIRTFYNSQMTIPNAEIMNATIDNLGRRRYRRTSTTISVTYATTPEQLEAFCEGIREIIRKHPDTRKDYFHVYVSKFAASSIDIMLYCFHECPDWGAELRERHRLYLDIIRLARRLGVEFAFPTQTIHLEQEQQEQDAKRPHKPTVPSDPDAALQYGRRQADEIVAALPAKEE